MKAGGYGSQEVGAVPSKIQAYDGRDRSVALAVTMCPISHLLTANGCCVGVLLDHSATGRTDRRPSKRASVAGRQAEVEGVSGSFCIRASWYLEAAGRE